MFPCCISNADGPAADPVAHCHSAMGTFGLNNTREKKHKASSPSWLRSATKWNQNSDREIRSPPGEDHLGSARADDWVPMSIITSRPMRYLSPASRQIFARRPQYIRTAPRRWQLLYIGDRSADLLRHWFRRGNPSKARHADPIPVVPPVTNGFISPMNGRK